MKHTVYRSSITGKFVSKRFARRHPDTTERESVGVLKAIAAKLTTLRPQL